MRIELFRRSLVALAVALAPASSFAQGEAAMRIEMLSSAQVQPSRVTLGEVAYLSSPDPQLLRRAMALPVGFAPRAGEASVLDKGRLASWVATRLQMPAESIRWEGATSTVVRSVSREVDGDALVALARPTLFDHLKRVTKAKGIDGSHIELVPVSLPVGVSVPVRGTEFRVRPLSAVPPGKRMLVWLDVFADQRHVKAIPICFEVRIYADTVVVAQPGRSAEGDDEHHTSTQEVDVAKLLSRDGASAPAWLPPQHAKHAPRQAQSSAGEKNVLNAADVHRRTAVARGDRLTVVAHSGRVSLESRVEVLQTGAVGQLVRVRPTNGTADLIAKVIGPGQLELQQ